MAPPVALVHSTEMDDYDLGPDHPLKSARVTNAVSLMRAYGLLEGDGGANVIAPEPATEEDLLLVHAPEYLEAVRAASAESA